MASDEVEQPGDPDGSAGSSLTTSRRQDRLVATAAALGLILLAWPALHQDRWFFGDIEHFWFPLRYEYSRYLMSGDSVLWSPSLYCGTYLHGEGQLGLLHPATLLLYRVVSFPLAYDIESWIRYPLLVLGMYALLRRWKLPRAAALAGGAVLLGGTSLNYYGFQHLPQILAHIPWQLVCIDVFLRDPDPRRKTLAWLALCLLTGSHLLLGYYQISLMVALTGLVYALAIAGLRARPLALLATSQALGLLLAGLQWLPVLDVLRASHRVDTPWSERMFGSLHPYNLIQSILPYVFSGGHFTRDPRLQRNTAELDAYNGLFTILLAIWAVARIRTLPSLRPVLVAGVVLVLLGWAIGMGQYGGLYPIMAKLPVIGSFRGPSRYRAISQIGLAMLMAIGLTDLIARRERSESAVPRGVGLVASVAALFGAAPSSSPWSPNITPRASGLPASSSVCRAWPPDGCCSWPRRNGCRVPSSYCCSWSSSNLWPNPGSTTILGIVRRRVKTPDIPPSVRLPPRSAIAFSSVMTRPSPNRSAHASPTHRS